VTDKHRKKRSKKPATKKPIEAVAAPEPAKPEAETSPAAKRSEPARPERAVVKPVKPRTKTPVRIIAGAAAAWFGLTTTFLLMAYEEQIHRGPLWGLMALLVGIGGVFALMGSHGESDVVSVRRTAIFDLPGEPLPLAPLITVPLALLILLAGAAIGGVDALPMTIALALAPLFLSAIKRPALLVFVVASYLFLPTLGAYGLWDPWETHYGEVAREILARDDWISLWWAQEDFFWSKPILIFWVESLSMGMLGTDFHADANPANPEWAIRLPHFLLTMGAVLSVYALVQRVVSKRAGAVAAIVLATTPHFFFLAHQAITDMPFVATMTIAMSMLGHAITADPEREVTRYKLGPVVLSARHLVAGVFLAIVVPQVLYLLSRNVTLMDGFFDGLAGRGSIAAPFGWHYDLILSGSAGNHGVEGNSDVTNVVPYLNGIFAQPMAQGLFWLLGGAGVFFFILREKTARGLYMIAFYIFCGLAFMAKGIPGFALPGLVALLFLFAARRWDLLLDGHLRAGLGVFIIIVVGVPWYVAMYVRHGPPFTERLLVHDHINRLTSGVHGDTGSIEYFVEQMGYGLFPWIAIGPLALAGWAELRKRPSSDDGSAARRRQIIILVTLWLAAAFTLFSAMTTKFHHYIFPSVPAAAILVGLALDRLLGPETKEETTLGRVLSIVATVLAVLAPVPAILGVAGAWGNVRGIIPERVMDTPEETDWVLTHGWSPFFCGVLISLGIIMLAASAALFHQQHSRVKPALAPLGWRPAAITTGVLAAPVIVAIVGRDLSWVTDARPQGYERLIHLFVYNYGRPWPSHFDYRPILTGFAIVAGLVVLLAAVPVIRAAAARAFLGVALAFTLWALDVYIIDLSPHWGQRELVKRYYEDRRSNAEPLVAWQMNWKGENFYSGNHVQVFVQLDNRALTEWLARQPEGSRVFFMLEHGRLANLRNIVRGAEIENLTTERENNKFILVRATLGPRPAAARPRATLQ
jgi:4-amino-4-deoxy-L-arabinose transferase-like glycosyltransferase